jgi:hypothetical protein
MVMTYYEEKYTKWFDIHYNREKLVSFFEKIEQLPQSDELSILLQILDDHNSDRLKELLNGDETSVRLALIEKWAREASLDILYDGRYSKETLRFILNLPKEDYQLLLKRVEEIVNSVRDISIQSDTLTDIVPSNETLNT